MRMYKVFCDQDWDYETDAERQALVEQLNWRPFEDSPRVPPRSADWWFAKQLVLEFVRKETPTQLEATRQAFITVVFKDGETFVLQVNLILTPTYEVGSILRVL